MHLTVLGVFEVGQIFFKNFFQKIVVFKKYLLTKFKEF